MRDYFRITPQELRILKLIAQGLSNKQIAAYIGIKYCTLNTHINSLYLKIGVSGEACGAARVKAVLYYLENKEVLERERL